MIRRIIRRWLNRKTILHKFEISENDIDSVLAGQIDTQMATAVRAIIVVMEEDKRIEVLDPKLSDSETKYALGACEALDDLHQILLEKLAKKQV